MAITHLLASLVIIYLAAQLGAELAERLRAPAVLGQLLGGLVVGMSGLGLLDPAAEPLHLLAEVGVILLLFEVGLETHVDALMSIRGQALRVAAIGALLPFGLGMGVAHAFGLDPLAGAFVGAGLSATSIGISARVLGEQGLLTSPVGSVILGAALVDDVMGVTLLSVLGEVAQEGPVGAWAMGLAVLASVGFLALVVTFGRSAANALVYVMTRTHARGTWFLGFLAFAFGMAWLADVIGSAALIGAFAAGVLVQQACPGEALERQLRPVADVFTPIFFVSVGASVSLASLSPFDPAARAMFELTIALVVVATIGKLIAGLGARMIWSDRLVVGVGMLPRGEVGLVFAGLGLTTGVLTPGVHAGLVGAIGLTTLAAPLWLRVLLAPREAVRISLLPVEAAQQEDEQPSRSQ